MPGGIRLVTRKLRQFGPLGRPPPPPPPPRAVTGPPARPPDPS
jgi:hypothetical protein